MESNPDNKRTEWAGGDIIAPNVLFSTPPFKRIFSALSASKLVAANEHLTSWAWLAPGLPDDLIVKVADAEFQIGVGGLHSVDEPGVFQSDDTHVIIDLDVTSYYPSIIIQNRLAPNQIGPDFYKDMRLLRDKRVAAKKAGDKVTSDAIKLIVNSTFGHLNNRWSPLRSIPDALRITVNGQLYLLMLIESLHDNGAQILSANTDGVTIRWTRGAAELFLDGIIADWQSATGFVLERADYAVYARRDINGYLALTSEGKVKLKGAFQPDAAKGDGQVVKQAAIANILHGTPIDHFIHETFRTSGIRPFLYYQRCQNGGELFHGSDLVGRLARWYTVGRNETIKRRNPAGTFAKIPNGENAWLAMKTDSGFPPPDFSTYVERAAELVQSTQVNGDTK
jgi:hypothetical protein